MKRLGYIKRKVGMPRPKHPMRRKRKPNKAKERAAVERFADSTGLYFDRIALVLPKDHKLPIWKPGEDVKEPSVCTYMHATWCEQFDGESHGECWLCGALRVLEAHHIVPGSDELTNIVMLCGHGYSDSCHRAVQDNPSALPAVLRAKVSHDKINTNWLRLTILRGSLWPFDSLDPTED